MHVINLLLALRDRQQFLHKYSLKGETCGSLGLNYTRQEEVTRVSLPTLWFLPAAGSCEIRHVLLRRPDTGRCPGNMLSQHSPWESWPLQLFSLPQPQFLVCPPQEQGLLVPRVAVTLHSSLSDGFSTAAVYRLFLLAEAPGSDERIKPSTCKNQILQTNPVTCSFRRKAPAPLCTAV